MKDKLMDEMKQEYRNIPIPGQLEELVKDAIMRAKEAEGAETMEQKHTIKRKSGMIILLKRTALTAAAALAVVTVMANSNAGIAHAMGKIPVLGTITKVVTFRTFESKDNKMEADIKVPKVEEEGAAPLNKTAEEYTNEIIAQYKADVAASGGEYQESVITDYEVAADNEILFSLRLNTIISKGSSDNFSVIYHMDKRTGEMINLKDLFTEQSDYTKTISDYIKEQMRTQMAADEMIAYNLDSEIPEFDFEEISEEQNFYVNEEGKLNIVFDKYEVAPGYMGIVEFIIPKEAIEGILQGDYVK